MAPKSHIVKPAVSVTLKTTSEEQSVTHAKLLILRLGIYLGDLSSISS